MAIRDHFKSLLVTKKTWETADTVTLTLEADDHYQPGQFISFLVDLNGEELVRSYSLSSIPSDGDYLQVTIKRVARGKVSNYLLDQLQPGSKILTAPPGGHFYQPRSRDQNAHLLLIGGGSGVTPLYSILRHEIAAYKNSHLTFISCHRTTDDIIFAEGLADLASRYPERFHLHHFISQTGRPRGPGDWHFTRLNPQDLENVLSMEGFSLNSPSHLAYLCGPDGLMAVAETTLRSLGMPPDRLAKESFTPAKLSPADVLAAATPGGSDVEIIVGPRPAEVASGPVTLEVVLDGSTKVLEGQTQQNILETLLDAGLEPPYSCLSGTCMACLARIEEGRVWMEDCGVLSKDNLTAKEVLTCQAQPVSKKVRVSFDFDY